MRNLPRAASVLVGVAALSQLLPAFSNWRAYQASKDGPQSWDGGVLLAIYAVAWVVAAVVFIVWLWQVRGNAERFCKASHRHGRGWVIGGWLVPVIAFWYPKQIVDDIIAASSPRTSPQAEQLPLVHTRIVQVWWITWIASNLVDLASPGSFSGNAARDDLLLSAGTSAISAVLGLVSAVYAVRVIQLIESLQAAKPQTAWWETDELVG